MWSGNFLEVEAPGVGSEELATLADDLLGRHGLGHRLVVPADPERGAELAPRFRELGWRVDRSLYMVLRRPVDRPRPAVLEVSREKVEAVRRAVAEDDPDFSPEAVEQQALRDARLDRVANGRWFLAPADGEPGGACVLYEQDGIGQVETVGTAPEQRGRHLASSVVFAAAGASRRAGHELTFIVADAEDWPWKLYQRLGFDPVGEACSFLRKPDQVAGG